ncbi:MAG: 4-hydroxythreonine-4-phosphate dehydrogenase PdxA [Spirochaetaceae bacterium]|nr:4-hydroxythreonine-4-phosphate dehydrogenase PdxA [Spirochaetaceae bacterium]
MKPKIAITMGDPAGIGPEIIVKALNSPEVQNAANYIICGNRKILENACTVAGISQSILNSNFVEIENCGSLEMDSYKIGEIFGKCGKASFDYIKKAIELALTGKVQAVATAPINKESLKAGEIPFIGHTEIFGELTNTKDPLTLFEVNNLRIFFLTRHVSLKQACSMVTKERICDYVKRCTKALHQLGIKSGTMAIAGLNPHSGEHGLFGQEETLAITPAVQELTKDGYNVVGPISADSVFHQALQGKFNSVLSLYHDQGHIAAKTYNFEKTISITCGMPILRTSVDHGTAFDIAGKNLASEISMIEAILVAAKYAPNWISNT